MDRFHQPAGLSLRAHQKDAVSGWFAAKGRGIYAMATGAGKTIAALATAEAVFKRTRGPLALVIVAPYLALVEQWDDSCRRWGLAPIRCVESRRTWSERVASMVYLLNRREQNVLCLIVSNATFATVHFQKMLGRIQVPTLLIADEVHNLGAERWVTCLPEKVTMRLGLSATPERWMDDEGTVALNQYFGSIVALFTLKEALASKILCPYDYHPIVVELTESETIEYLALTRKLARSLGVAATDANAHKHVQRLLFRRARLLGNAHNKTAALLAAIQPYREYTQTLIYCGDGRVIVDGSSDEDGLDGDDSVSFERQVSVITRSLHANHGMLVNSYTARTPPDRRRAILKDFTQGRLHALVAIRCLDEGIDMPSISRAFILASSTNPRQFIQRRGRLLRQAPGKTHADIFDFIIAPPYEFSDALDSSSVRSVGRRIVEREMVRVLEFAQMARNHHQARRVLAPITSSLGLHHL